MIRLVMPILITLGLVMMFFVVTNNMLHAIYFTQLEILVFLGFMYFELKNKNNYRK